MYRSRSLEPRREQRCCLDGYASTLSIARSSCSYRSRGDSTSRRTSTHQRAPWRPSGPFRPTRSTSQTSHRAPTPRYIEGDGIPRRTEARARRHFQYVLPQTRPPTHTQLGSFGGWTLDLTIHGAQNWS